MSWRERSFPRPIRYLPDTPETAETPGFSGTEKRLVAPLVKAPLPSAVLVFHGMGQQVRFQTLSDLASAILNEAEARKGTVTDLHIGIAPRTDSPGRFLARAEIAWKDKTGVDHAAHVYEAYWAPLTEGKVTYWETIMFLLGGGWNGICCIFPRMKWSFERWVFGDFKKMPLKKATPFALLTVLAILLGTVGVIALAGAAVAQIAKSFSAPTFSEGIKLALNTIYSQIAVPWNSMSRWIAIHLHAAGASATAQLPMPGTSSHPSWWLYVIVLLVWCLLVASAYFVRFFIIAYAGSVAAYLSPYKDSKFEELRGAIQKVGLDAARLIFYGSAPTPGAEKKPAEVDNPAWIPDYQNIVFVAHSLGTVLAYDTLNAIFNIENTSKAVGASNRAVERTRALITFGSPLDKAAFIFRAQFNRNTNIGRIREQMACAIQPLITNYSFRFDPRRTPSGPRWINLWSPLDIFSGSLKYYDDAVQAPSCDSMVINRWDYGCWIPLYAHVQYWSGKLLRKTVYDQLV